MDANTISDLERYVKAFFADDVTGHGADHTFRVRDIAVKLAESEGADIERVQLAALLHDVDDKKLVKEDPSDHKNAISFMTEHGLSEAEISEIILIISQISFSGYGLNRPDTIEAMVVQDADRLDAIGAVGIARAFACGAIMGQPPFASDERRNSTLEHFHKKLLKLKDGFNTRSAICEAEIRHRFMLEFLQELFRETGIR